MTFQVAPGQEPRTFRLEGELDVAETEVLLDGVGDLPDGGDVVLDLRKLVFIDSSGVRALLQLAGRMHGDDVLVLRDAAPAVRRVFDLVSLEETGLPIRVEGLER